MRRAGIFAPLHFSNERLQAEFIRYLDRRDGEANCARQQRLDRLLPHGFSAEDRILANVFARIYQAEDFAVKVFLEGRSEHAVLARIALQERDHVVILASLVRAFGGRAHGSRLPVVLRWILGFVVQHTEGSLAVFLFLGELAGVALFLAVRRRIVERWPGPEGSSVLRLFDELIVDEVGHLAFNHARLAPWQLRLARWLARPFFMWMSWREPIAKQHLRAAVSGAFSWQDIPAEILAQAWAPAAHASSGPLDRRGRRHRREPAVTRA
jgi:hypothetical protein